MAAEPIGLRGDGPLARAIVEAWLTGGSTSALAWSIDPQAASLSTALRRWSQTHGARLQGEAIRFGDGRRVELGEGSDAAPERRTIDARGWRPSVGRKRIDPAPALAAAPVLERLLAGPGLRWVHVDALLGAREGHPNFGSVLASAEVIEPGEGLSAAIARRLPGLAGKLSAGATHGPQHGESLMICAMLAPGASLEGVRDLLVDSARPPVEAAPGARSDEALGRAAVLVDTSAIQGVGPLIRVLAHYDPAPLLAAATWEALT
ncbi:hypothetical protein G6O69_11170 [Pseudenhygromyxa sp. WMMC2535]|uniref:hypothetical protein n=1 Tax=Pseudenhygromyxa sp. WMMC2535 TaxID=2712867 RepID=UPI0015546078|nr:hypothetical protein [Pseudenhygromyxa sp. WMMC2535]NVB38392.1 hypothetical protein [Pseudenhygromyxa sp. WMMC2535]